MIAHNVFKEEDYNALNEFFTCIDTKENVSVELQTTPVFGSQWLEIYMKNIYDSKNRRLNTIGWIRNISDIKEQEAKAHHHLLQAQRDGLTGLYNSTTAIELINDILHSTDGKKQRHLLIFMDLDNFKQINDTFGNDVLIDLSSTFAHTFRKTDIVGRFGGDEFFAFLTNVVSFPEMEHIFKELVAKCERVYEKDGIKIPVSDSFGIALAPNHGEDFETLAKKADAMLLRVKKEGKNRYRVYDAEGEA